MTMEAAGLVEQRREGVGHVSNKIIRKKRCRVKRKITTNGAASSVPKTLSELFLTCRGVFKGPGTVPPPHEVQRICDVLDNMKPEDVGLSMDLQFFQPRSSFKGSPRVTCTTIYKCKNFSLCIFFLPPTAVIPLHNHPGMTVFSKLLLGKMHIKSYDWVDPHNSATASQLRLAKLKSNSVFTAPCDTSVLYPTSGGNIHEFTAITPCAVLDVLGPPYSSEDGRDCSYYKDFPYSSFSNEEREIANEDDNCYGWLKETEVPNSLQMDGIEYLGPQIDEYSC